jgi:hypothetical protein
MLNKEFKINIETSKKAEGLESKTGSLAGSTELLTEESKTII